MRAKRPSGVLLCTATSSVQGGRQTLVHLLSGGLAAGAVRAALQPLDTCKTRLQSGGLATLSVRGLYRGVVPGVIGIVPAAALYMATFQALKSMLCRRTPRKFRNGAIALAAGIGDVAASLVRVPCEVLKQRLQVGLYPNFGHALADVLRLRSLPAVYAGLGAQLARDIPYAAVEFVFYENLKSAAVGPDAAKKMRTGQSLAVGAASGAAAAIMSNPMDVVKTRLMTQLATGTKARYRGISHALVKVAREEGILAFWKGITPRIAAKTLQSALFFATYETLRQTFTTMLAAEERGKPT